MIFSEIINYNFSYVLSFTFLGTFHPVYQKVDWYRHLDPDNTSPVCDIYGPCSETPADSSFFLHPKANTEFNVSIIAILQLYCWIFYMFVLNLRREMVENYANVCWLIPRISLPTNTNFDCSGFDNLLQLFLLLPLFIFSFSFFSKEIWYRYSC